MVNYLYPTLIKILKIVSLKLLLPPDRFYVDFWQHIFDHVGIIVKNEPNIYIADKSVQFVTYLKCYILKFSPSG